VTEHEDLDVLGCTESGEQQVDASEGHSERAWCAGCRPWRGRRARKVLIKTRDRALGTRRQGRGVKTDGSG
jgi:hypothetical protein